MALTPQQEADVVALTAGLSADEIAAMKSSAQEKRVTELRDEWVKKRSALDTAAGNYLAALDSTVVAMKSKVAADITAARAEIVTAKAALVAALQAAK